MEKREPCPGTYHYPDLSQRIEVDGKDKKKRWLITYCGKCQYNYDIEEYTGKAAQPKPDTEKFQWPDNRRSWPKS